MYHKNGIMDIREDYVSDVAHSKQGLFPWLCLLVYFTDYTTTTTDYRLSYMKSSLSWFWDRFYKYSFFRIEIMNW